MITKIKEAQDKKDDSFDVREAFKNRCIRQVDLATLDLTSCSMDGLVIENSRLIKVDLSNVRWRNARLINVDMEGGSICKVVMRMCSFENLRAKEADLTDARLENCEVKGCCFQCATFGGASLIDSDFSRSSFEGADLTNVDASSCNLRGADFRSAVIINTSFRDADLRGADFTCARIESVDFTGADLRGAVFDPDIEKALFSEKNNELPPTELIDAVAPLVASLLKEAESKCSVPNNKWSDELRLTLAAMGAPSLDEDSVKKWDEQVGFVLNQAGKVGVDALFESLRSSDEKTPDAVATMLEEFVKELGLQPGVSTGELVEALMAKLQKE